MNTERPVCTTDLSDIQNSSWSEAEYLELSRFMLKERGFSFAGYKPAYIARRLGARVRNTGSKTPGDYIRRLKRDPEELKMLYNTLTVNVSSFFRNNEVFESIKTLVLPAMLKKKRKDFDYTLRVWSIGCSTGEEPYSLNIMLRKSLAFRLKGFRVEILATDIDESVLAHAKRGLYSCEKFTAENMGIMRTSFQKRDGLFQIRDRYREGISFIRQDIFDFKPMQDRFDMVLCRNVMIYFTKETHLKIYRYLADNLGNDGVLVLGKAEVMLYPKETLFENIDVENRIYKKAETAEEAE